MTGMLGMTRVTCPFCLKVHDVEASSICPESGETLPEDYIRGYSTVPRYSYKEAWSDEV